MSLAGETDAIDSTGQHVERRLAIAAGGTAGHITAGLAVAQAYLEAFPDASLCFIGTVEGLESGLVRQAGYPLEIVSGTPVARESLFGKARAIWNLARGATQAREVLSRRRVALVIGFGGYASAGVLLAARSLGLRVAAHEANVVPGLANRLLAPLADRIYLGSEATLGSIRGAKICVTGNPIRSEIVDAARQRSRADSSERPARVVVLGGSLGSHFLNREAPPLLARVSNLGVPLEVRHQTGDIDRGEVADLYRKLGLPASTHPFISDMVATYRWADFAVTSAGALTLAELAAFGIPALLIPLRCAAGDHQRANAEAFARSTGDWWTSEEHWDVSLLAGRIAGLLRGVEDWESASKRTRELAKPGAASAVVTDCEELMSARW